MFKRLKFLYAFLLAVLIIASSVFYSLSAPRAVDAAGNNDNEFLIQQILDLTNQLRTAQNTIDDLRRQLEEANNRPPAQPPAPTLPQVRLQSPQSLTIEAGEQVDATLTFRNIGNASAASVFVSASTEGAFTVEFINDSNSIGNLPQNVSRNVAVRISADASATAGAKQIQFRISYRNNTGVETTTDALTVIVVRETTHEQVILENFSASGLPLVPGSDFNINATLANVGSLSASNIQVALVDGLSADGVINNSNAPFIRELAPNARENLNFPLSVSMSATHGTHELKFRITGWADGEEIRRDFSFFVTITDSETTPLTISSTAPTAFIRENETAVVSVIINNPGQNAARNISVTASFDEDAIRPFSSSRLLLHSLGSGETHYFSFDFSPTDKATRRTHMINFEIKYTDLAGRETTVLESIGINAYGSAEEDEEQRSRPRVIVSEYSVEPMTALAGREFDMFLTFFNTSQTQRVSNIKITLEAVEHTELRGPVFTPVGGSNTLFVDALEPRETFMHTVRMFAAPDALPRAYNINVTFEYEDEEFTALTEREQITVPVRQIARLEVANLNMQDFAQASQQVFVTFTIINSGRIPLTNLRVRLEGDEGVFDTQGMDIHAGNLGRGNQSSFNGTFTPMLGGAQDGVIIVSAEDDMGELVEYRHEFIMHVQDTVGGDFIEGDFSGGDFSGVNRPGGTVGGTWDGVGDPNFIAGPDWMGNFEEEGGISWLVWVIGGVVVLGLIAVIIIIVRRRKRRNDDLFEDL